MLIGERYYRNRSDIQLKRRKLANGSELENRSNIKLEHAFVRKLVNQKIGYLLTKPVGISSDNESISEALNDLFDRRFWKLIKVTGREAINKGIAWIQVYFDAYGAIAFKHIPSEQIIPLWTDAAHEELQGLIRIYDILVYEGATKTTRTKVEYWTANGVSYWVMMDGTLIDDTDVSTSDGGAVNYHFMLNGTPQNWTRIPFVAFRYNDLEQPLIDIIKSLVDNYNTQASVNADILADIPRFIFKLIGYGGQDLEEFINDLQHFLAIKLQPDGDVDKLQPEPNIQGVENTLKQARKDIYEYGAGVDAQDAAFGTASGIALKFKFADLDGDCNLFEAEMQASMENLIWFIKQYLAFTGQGNYENDNVEITFNRDIIIAESDVITDCRNSEGIISRKTIMRNHPWVTDEDEEWKAMQDEEEAERDELDAYSEAFNARGGAINESE